MCSKEWVANTSLVIKIENNISGNSLLLVKIYWKLPDYKVGSLIKMGGPTKSCDFP